MRLSDLHAPTLREAPRDLDHPGQRALARAGLFRLLDGVPGAGLAVLPVGVIALERLATTLRTAIVAPRPQPIFLPSPPAAATVSPADLVAALLARDLRSYRELPLVFHTAATVLAATPRARAGLLGAREEPTLDLWIAAADDAFDPALATVLSALDGAMTRLGLAPQRVAVSAVGGSVGERWVAPDLTDEVAFAWCGGCQQATLARLAPVGHLAAAPMAAPGPRRAVATPDQRSVPEVAAFLGRSPAHLLKTLIVEADGALVAALVPGDRELSLDKLGRALGAQQLRLAGDSAVVAATGAPVGFAGPVDLALPIVADSAAVPGSAWITGGNAEDLHLVDVSPGRDFVATHIADITTFEDRDPCPLCTAPRARRGGTELVRVERYGAGPADRIGLTVDTPEGGARPVALALVRIRLAHLLGAVGERGTGEAGLVWPIAAAPWDVVVVSLGQGADATGLAAEAAAAALGERGIATLLDDRELRPGQKLGDAELMGHPLIAVIGRRGLERGVAELRRRARGDVLEVPLDGIASAVLAELAGGTP